MTVPQIDPYPEAPGPSDPGEVFDEKAFAFTQSQEPRRQQMNQVAQFVNDTVTQFAQDVDQAVDDATQTAVSARDTAVASANTATQAASDAESDRTAAQEARDAALAVVGFAGKWADLTGALNTPATVYHQGAYWRLLNDLADITASEPANDNADWLFVYSNAELRRKLLDEATLYADFVNGDYRLYEGVGAGVVRGKSFSDLFNFNRSSDATGQGVSSLETVTADVARFVYSPEIKKRQGLLIEEQRTNLLLWSDEFDNQVYWARREVDVTPNASVAPDGQLLADLLIPTTSQNSHRLSSGGFSLISGETYSASVNVKSAGYNFAFLTVGGVGAFYDLISNEVIAISGDVPGFIIDLRADIKPAARGWSRLFLEFKADTTISTSLRIGCNESSFAGEENYSGDGISGIFVFRANLEQGSSPTSDIKTEGTQVTRAADNCSRTLGAEVSSGEGTWFACLKFRPIPSLNGQVLYYVNSPKRLLYFNGTTALALLDSAINYPENPGIDGRECIAASGSSSGGILARNSATSSVPSADFSVLFSGALDFGRDGFTAGFCTYRILYIPRVLSEAELIALTTPETE